MLKASLVSQWIFMEARGPICNWFGLVFMRISMLFPARGNATVVRGKMWSAQGSLVWRLCFLSVLPSVPVWAGRAALLWLTPCWRGWNTRSRWTYTVMWRACELKGTTWCRQRISTYSSTRPCWKLQSVATQKSLPATCTPTSRSSPRCPLERRWQLWNWSLRWADLDLCTQYI